MTSRTHFGCRICHTTYPFTIAYYIFINLNVHCVFCNSNKLCFILKFRTNHYFTKNFHVKYNCCKQILETSLVHRSPIICIAFLLFDFHAISLEKIRILSFEMPPLRHWHPARTAAICNEYSLTVA